MAEFTPDERDLLRVLRLDIGRCIAEPTTGIQFLEDSRGTGRWNGFTYQYGPDAILGQWRERIADAWRFDGQPWRWNDGQILREARITYTRLREWCEQLPDDIRRKARACCALEAKSRKRLDDLPLERLALDQLMRIALDAINLDDPEPPLFDPEETAHA